MNSLSGKACSMARTGLGVLICLAPSAGRAQAPSQGPVLGEGAAQMDAPVPGRSVTPGQDTFLYPSPVVPGAGGLMVPKPLGSLAPFAPLQPLRRTPGPGPLPRRTSYPEPAGGSSSPTHAGRMLQPWVKRPGRGFWYAIVLSPQGTRYHWIWWSSLNGYYYLFDSAARRYLGVYDRRARIYRPLSAVTQRWATAITPPVRVPSGPPPVAESGGLAAPIQPQATPSAVSPQPTAGAQVQRAAAGPPRHAP
jgi:hypothetical protein